jgi:tRNA(fMet)-specific endonuclease VapC
MPASGDVLLDTSVVIPFFKGDKDVGAQLASATIYLPQIVLGELYCGSYLSANPAQNRNEIQNFLVATTVLSSGVATAEQYGKIRAALAKSGTPIPENDIWIAALAVEHGLPLAARVAHLNKIAG